MICELMPMIRSSMFRSCSVLCDQTRVSLVRWGLDERLISGMSDSVPRSDSTRGAKPAQEIAVSMIQKFISGIESGTSLPLGEARGPIHGARNSNTGAVQTS